MKAYELIEWSEKYLGNKKELAHGFRFPRNLIHENKVVEEQDALEALRHITILLNLLFPFETASESNIATPCRLIQNLAD